MYALKMEGFGVVDVKAEAKRLREEVATAVQVAAITGASELSKGFYLPGSGRAYRSRRGDGSIHIASVAGASPANDTEELIDNLQVDLSKARGIFPVAWYGWTNGGAKPYATIAGALFDGTADGRIAPRGGWQEAAEAGLVAAFASSARFGAFNGMDERFTGSAGYQAPF